MNVILIGMNHKTAPLEIRERLSLACGGDVNPLAEMKKISCVSEAFFLSTCNRVEAMVGASDESEVLHALRSFIFRQGNLTDEEMQSCLYVYRNKEAVRHLFRVASSLDSLVMGEPQILGQIKDAYRRAAEENATGIMFNRIIHLAFRVAKRVRTETGIAGNAVSVSFAAVELAKKIFGTLKGKTILLIGAGEMSELAGRHLLNHGAGRVLIANRTYRRAIQIAEEFQGEAVAFEDVPEILKEVDIVISSTGSPGYVVTTEMVTAALHRRKNRLLFLIDIAVPRDIEPAAGDVDNVYLYNIDDLQGIVDDNMKGRQLEASKAEAIIAEEVDRYEAWVNSLQVVPTIVSLREKTQIIVKGEMERLSARFRNMTGEDRESMAILIDSVVNKILHDPITHLKEESEQQAALPYVAALRRLFDLDGDK
ncbi:MAG: glutamyl-tRNA reductase [Smithellaceae bacterium]|nr:glutamyl-tRNA reductase [Smithellaceae bacterium]